MTVSHNYINLALFAFFLSSPKIIKSSLDEHTCEKLRFSYAWKGICLSIQTDHPPSWTWLQQTFGDTKHQMDWSQWDSRQEQRSFSVKLLKIMGVFAIEMACFEDRMRDSFGDYHTTWLNILKALCSVPILNIVPTSALKSCKWILSRARASAKHLLLKLNIKTIVQRVLLRRN